MTRSLMIRQQISTAIGCMAVLFATLACDSGSRNNTNNRSQGIFPGSGGTPGGGAGGTPTGNSDLQVMTFDAMLMTTTPNVGDQPLAPNVVIQNTGTDMAGAHTVGLYSAMGMMTPGVMTGFLYDRFPVASLAAGASLTLASPANQLGFRTVTPALNAGMFTVAAIVDDTNAVGETNEMNNIRADTQLYTFQSVAAADLTPGSFIMFSSSPITFGINFQATMTAANVGNTSTQVPFSVLAVVLDSGGSQNIPIQGSGVVQLQALGPNMQATVNMNCNINMNAGIGPMGQMQNLVAGPAQFFVILDVDPQTGSSMPGLVTEASENNNVQVELVTLQ